jgi:hypothetical protein
MSWRKDIDRIFLPQDVWQGIVAHCRRKVDGDFLPDESKVNRAFGILAGVQAVRELHVRKVLPVKRNARNQEPLKSFMDKMMKEHAVPSSTPLSERGWITDPQEFRECLEICNKDDLSIFGAYHIHVVPWEGDPLRDTPTRLDTLLVKESKMFSFIISLVDLENPSMRAFYEGRVDQEAPIIIV